MGQRQSKDELLYQQASSGNIEGIKALHSDGAGLEWTDKEGKTPLILACTNLQLYNVAKTLIELGANVHAYCPGAQNGTALHFAAKRGLEHTVKLLLSHGANALQMNDYGQTPLDVARAKGHTNIVRAIEEHVCLFAGWLREICGPRFLECLASQFLSRKVWVVILPCGYRKPEKPFKLEMMIYATAQDAQPRMIVQLWKANLQEPNFCQPDPVAVISDIPRIPKRWKRKRAIASSREPRRSRIKLAPLHESDKQQLERFCNACKGIPQKQVMPPFFPFTSHIPTAPAAAPPTAEDEELAMAIKASLHSASQERPLSTDTHAGSIPHAPLNLTITVNSSVQEKSYATEASTSNALHRTKFEVHEAATPENDGPILYPSLDTSPTDASFTSTSTSRDENGGHGPGSCCTICLDAPVEGACIPCGHMVGCMSCLNEIEEKKWGCPVCRTKIDQVVRIYSV